MKKSIIIFLLTVMTTKAQQVIPLYEGIIPNNKATVKADYDSETVEKANILILKNITKPSLTVYKAAKPNGKAVIICPGGGYYILAAGHEGSDAAKRFNEWGITAFVLKYRLPTSNILENNEIGPLMDAQQAIRMVREQAKDFGIDPVKIGIMGFSAGGHLASTASTHFQKQEMSDSKTSSRPDFTILAYPVVSFDPKIYHQGSAEALLGKNASPEKVILYSNEKQVNKDTPPCFLVHSTDDEAVPVENSIAYMLACKQYKVPVELHIYPKGGHGYGMNNKTTDDEWMERLKNWLARL